MENKPPFKSLGHALGWFNEHNPARARSMNVLEPERGQKPSAPDFSGQSPNDLYASLLAAILKVLKPLSKDQQLAWIWRNIGDRMNEKNSVINIAKRLHRDDRTIYRYLNETKADLDKEFLRRQLIPALEPLKTFRKPRDCKAEIDLNGMSDLVEAHPIEF